ncbi:MAG: hypothetical protein ABR562_03980 [Thermoplasmatota archaeon]
MRSAPLLVAVPLLLALAGCAGSDHGTPLDSVFPTDLSAGNATAGATVKGLHIEGRVNEGPWGSSANGTADAGKVDGAPMTAPNALGGGSEATVLTIPANATATVSLRLTEGDKLAGYVARYFLSYGATPAANATGTDVPAGDEFHALLTKAGPFTVTVQLFAAAKDAAPVAVFSEPFMGHFAYHWAITGEVQPQHPGVGTWPTTADKMVDTYSIDLPAGVTVTANSAFDGTYTPQDGTDVDLGLYNPGGDGVACAAAGQPGSGAPVDPAQSSETLEGETDMDGTWSLHVGDVSGCGDQGYQYVNSGPVPYTVDLVVG